MNMMNRSPLPVDVAGAIREELVLLADEYDARHPTGRPFPLMMCFGAVRKGLERAAREHRAEHERMQA